jgi:pyruvate formate lyase activating enzyme
MGVGDVMAEVLKDRPFYEESGGGVTFSGGEPLLQPRFLRSLLDACRKAAVHTAVDTCGYAAWQDLLGLAALTDLFLYDLKMMDDRRHRQYTGASNGPILENLRALGRVHRNIWIRIPIIPGLSDGPEDLEAAARFAASIPGVQQVNLLPHHETGSAKFSRLGRPYRLEGTESPSSEQMAEAAEKFRTFGLNVKIGG